MWMWTFSSLVPWKLQASRTCTGTKTCPSVFFPVRIPKFDYSPSISTILLFLSLGFSFWILFVWFRRFLFILHVLCIHAMLFVVSIFSLLVNVFALLGCLNFETFCNSGVQMHLGYRYWLHSCALLLYRV